MNDGIADFDPTPYAAHLGCVRVALDAADQTREEIGNGSPIDEHALKAIGKLLSFPESFLPGAALYEIPELDAAAMVDELVTSCSEIEIEPENIDRVEIVWRKAAGKRAGSTTTATLKPVGKRERQAWRGLGRSPWWRLTLALDVWLMLTPRERIRLVHHELMHAVMENGKPKGRIAHDIEEFAATVARYGPCTYYSSESEVLAQAMARPTIAEELRTFDIDPATGQGLLFGADKMRPVGW